MKNFLEKTLRQNVMIEETEYLNEKLPLAFRGRYTFYKVETNGSPWIAIQPKADVGLAALRKDWIKIEKAAGLNCAIFFDSTSFYIKEKLLEAALLIEEHYDEICDELWYIYTSEENRRARLKQSRGYSDEKISEMFESQLCENEYRRHCKVVIDNNGTTEETIAQVRTIIENEGENTNG